MASDTRTKRQKLHRRFYTVMRALFSPLIRHMYAFRPAPAQKIEGPFLLLANHVTAADPVLIGVSMPQQMYFVASEHLMQKGLLSKLLRFFLDPIVRRKGDTAVTAVKEMLRCLKGGRSVCLFPEGTCSYDGTNPPMLPTVAKVAKTAGCSLVTYRFEGGYFTLPRWGRGIRKGSFTGGVVHVYTPEQLKTMRDAELFAAIEADLCENAYARIEASPAAYKSRHRAEYLESAFFLCPVCRRVGTVQTRGDTLRCSCGMRGRLDEQYRLSGLPVKTLIEWDALENDWLKKAADEPAFSFSDGPVTLSVNDDAHRHSAVASGTLTETAQTLSVGDTSFALSDITDMELVRRNLLVFSTDEGHYQISGSPSFNARKYMLLYRIRKGVRI